MEQKHGKARRVWVFDRGIVSEDNLALLRARGAHYLVGTPKRKLQACEQRLLDGPWTKAGAEGAYLLRAHWTEKDPAKLWQTYVQLTEAEAAFRTLKTDWCAPLWHWTEPRVEAHLLVAFLGYCLWVYVKKCCQHSPRRGSTPHRPTSPRTPRTGDRRFCVADLTVAANASRS